MLRNLSLLRFLFILALWACITAFQVENLELNLGEEQGISQSSSISNEVLQKIMQGVAAGNKDNIYFYGLLKLYGIAVSKDVPGAAQQFLRASSLGHKEGTTAYGVMMLTGALGKIDYTEALKYFREGVVRDDMVRFLSLFLRFSLTVSVSGVECSLALGQVSITRYSTHAFLLMSVFDLRMLMEGKGVPAPQYVEAALHLQRASDAGVPQAHHCLAVMYEYGRGIAQDFKKAIALYERAVEQNQIESMYNLGLMYAYGRGASQDFHQARSYFEKAANFQHAPSTYYIGVFKTYGYGCTVNYEQALRWFQRAVALGDDRIYKQAWEAAEELKHLIEKAHDENEQVIQSYHQKNEM